MLRNDWIDRLSQSDRINFLLTNRIPRRFATLAMGRLSRIETPFIRGMSFAEWRLFAGGFRLHEAKQTRFRSLHECFTRELKEGARPIARDPAVIVSPCDGVVGAHGQIADEKLFQIKWFPYTLPDLLQDAALVAKYRDGVYVTLRLRSSMYHRFHAPYDCRIKEVIYIAGDTWNVNPIALRRVERLFCKNERAVMDLELPATASVALVPVAAILVASIRFKFLVAPLGLRYRGPNRIACDTTFGKGEELGYFQHGSTIIVLGTAGLSMRRSLAVGDVIRMGEPLLEM